MRLALLAAALCAAQLAAAAQEQPKASDVLKAQKARPLPSPITDRFSVRAMYFPASVSTDMRVDDEENAVAGTDLSAEGDLGMKDKLNQARVEFTLRILERSRVRVDYFKLTRHGNALLARDIQFGDEIFTANDQVTSLLDWRMLNFTYLYSILHRERFELGAGVALHLFEAEARARVPAEQLNEERSGVAALPTLAMDANWRITNRFALTGRVNYLSTHIKESSGLVADYHADVQFRWRPNVAFGLGYTMLKTDVEVVDEGDLSGKFDFDVKGPELFVRASF